MPVFMHSAELAEKAALETVLESSIRQGKFQGAGDRVGVIRIGEDSVQQDNILLQVWDIECWDYFHIVA